MNDRKRITISGNGGNRCIDVPSAQREGVYFGFQGDLNLVDTENPSSKVFRP